MSFPALRCIATLALAALLCACAPNASSSPQDSGVSLGSSAPQGSGGPTSSDALGSPIRLVVDTDVAPDDVTAIASLLRDPDVELLAITVTGTGEAHCPGGMFVVRSILTMLDEEIPVTCGRLEPYGDAEAFPEAWRSGADSGGGLDLVSPAFAPDQRAAPDLLVELANAEAASGGRLTILTLGPVTNLASAVELDPAFAAKVRAVSMLGAVAVDGNVQTVEGVAPTAEWNAHADPTAVRMVLDAGFDLRLIPLDATNSVPLTNELFASLEADHAAGPADLVYELWAKNPYMLDSGFYLWDPLAAAAARDAAIVSTRAATLRVVEGAGPEGGRLVEDPAGAAVTIATGADRERFEALLLDRLRIGPPRENAFAPRGTVSVTAREDGCEAALEPSGLPAGSLRLVGHNATDGEVVIFLFELGNATWADVEAFVEDLSNLTEERQPPVRGIASVAPSPGGEQTGYADAQPGQLGVACVPGPFGSKPVALAGPFPVGP